MVSTLSPARPSSVVVHQGPELTRRLAHLTDYAMRGERVALSRHPAWLEVLRAGLHHVPFALEARCRQGKACGYLPLALVESYLFGRHLVSLPYLNSNGVQADTPEIAAQLVTRAVRLADELEVRHLELRHEAPTDHASLNGRMETKVHMRRELPDFPGPLWESFDPKVRNQVRKGEKNGLKVQWGGIDLLPEFYSIFSRNMRDLGTPVYGRSLFRSILSTFKGGAEICVVRVEGIAAAAGLVLHGKGVTEVPSASCLREYNPTCANMLLYWSLLSRAIERGQQVFDFGRSTIDSNTFKFKKQWGAKPEPATWQYHLRTGASGDLRPDNPRYQRLIRIWQRLPVRVTEWIGPSIVRGIP